MFDLFGSQKKLKSLFGTYVPPEIVREMVKSGATSSVNHLERKHINLLLVAVEGASEEEVGQRLGAAVTLASENGWHTCFLCSNFAVLVDAGVFANGPLESERADLVRRLGAEFGSDCKSLGGERTVAWGDYGSPTRRVLGPLLPDFLQIVAALERQPSGSHESLCRR
jgi:hypothetical protein